MTNLYNSEELAQIKVKTLEFSISCPIVFIEILFIHR